MMTEYKHNPKAGEVWLNQMGISRTVVGYTPVGHVVIYDEMHAVHSIPREDFDRYYLHKVLSCGYAPDELFIITDGDSNITFNNLDAAQEDLTLASRGAIVRYTKAEVIEVKE